MISFLISFLKKDWKLLFVFALVSVCMALFNFNSRLKHDNALLQSNLEKCRRGMVALGDANARCVEREAAIREDEQSRDAIISQLKTRQRVIVDNNTSEVIDDESRRAVIDRLNRPW